jgi:ligand-binding sensor domain-containing protein
LNKSILILLGIYVSGMSAFAQLPKTYRFHSLPSSSLPLTNSINEIIVQKDTVWFGTEKGLSLTSDGGITWTNFSGTAAFDNKGISAIAIKDNTIWVATGYTTKLGDEDVQTGGGLHYSTDHGVTWSFIPQPIDHQPNDHIIFDTIPYGSANSIRALAVTVPQQNITFDIALTKNAVWTASWAGMLRKSLDTGKTWQRVILPPDFLDQIDTSMTLSFDLSPVFRKLSATDSLLENDNHKVFSVYASDDTIIWVGTAGGINKSTDGGISWRKFSHQNQSYPISGNWIIALREQHYDTLRIIWAATRDTKPEETQGVSYSKDGGATWGTTLLGERAWNIAFDNSGNVVYIATDNGIFRSSDFGESWIRSGSIYDPSNLQRFVSTECYGVGVKDDTVWYGGSEGIAYTIDSPSRPFGSAWHIFRTAEQVENNKKTYSFPNPFSPNNEPVRLHYSLGTTNSGFKNITIRIFDYAMQPVRTLIQNSSRLSGKEYDEIWDGKNDNRSIVANGVYFYRVEMNDQAPIWGKILVLK